MRRPFYIANFALFSLLSLAIAAHSFAYLYRGIDPGNPFQLSFGSAGWAVPMHFFPSGLALLLSPLALSQRLRGRWPAVHRFTGLLYCGSVALAGVAGLLLAPRAQGGWWNGVAFALLACCWLGCTGRALWLATRGRSAEHRRWMLRSAALTFSAVTLRLYLLAGIALLNWPFALAYSVAAWACWTVNLVLIEMYLRRSMVEQRWRGREPGSESRQAVA